MLWIIQCRAGSEQPAEHAGCYISWFLSLYIHVGDVGSGRGVTRDANMFMWFHHVSTWIGNCTWKNKAGTWQFMDCLQHTQIYTSELEFSHHVTSWWRRTFAGVQKLCINDVIDCHIITLCTTVQENSRMCVFEAVKLNTVRPHERFSVRTSEIPLMCTSVFVLTVSCPDNSDKGRELHGRSGSRSSQRGS